MYVCMYVCLRAYMRDCSFYSVLIRPGTGLVTINHRNLVEYFPEWLTRAHVVVSFLSFMYHSHLQLHSISDGISFVDVGIWTCMYVCGYMCTRCTGSVHFSFLIYRH